MLFEYLFRERKSSAVLSKITGIACSKIDSCGCIIFIEGEPDGFCCSEEYGVISARLYAALEAAEERKLRTTAVACNLCNIRYLSSSQLSVLCRQ